MPNPLRETFKDYREIQQDKERLEAALEGLERKLENEDCPGERPAEALAAFCHFADYWRGQLPMLALDQRPRDQRPRDKKSRDEGEDSQVPGLAFDRPLIGLCASSIYCHRKTLSRRIARFVTCWR